MINLKMVASPADPKNDSMSSSEVLSLEPSYKEKHVVHLTEKSKASQGGNPEQNEASRKNKKKKEKSKSKYEVLTVQEPPRIEVHLYLLLTLYDIINGSSLIEIQVHTGCPSKKSL